jgi:chemotaxis protein MotB
MIIDGVQYRYLMSEKEFEENQYDGLANGDLSDSELEELAETKRDILAELEQAFKDEGIEATIDYDSGEVVLEESFLFATNSYELSAEGKKYLDSFMNVYTSVVLKEEYSSYIAQIVVEGHTDTSGSYSLNQTLSQNRADAVAQHCIAQNPQIKDIMQAIGCSYDYPVYNEDGTVNMDASRRVTFSFVFAG